MSNIRQHDYLELVRTYGVTFSNTDLKPPASRVWNQLVYASKGVLSVRTDFGTWVVPPYRAVWLPANVRCVLEVRGQVALRMVYLREPNRIQSGALFDRSRCTVINVTPLLRELILRVVKMGALYTNIANHRRIAGLIHDELHTIETVPLQLPYPRSTSAMAFVSAFEQSINAGSDINSTLLDCGIGRRTMERLFRTETGMSLGQWARRRKLLEGLRCLVEGETTSTVAFKLGYNSPSAFIAMFKRELGATPSSYFDPRSQL